MWRKVIAFFLVLQLSKGTAAKPATCATPGLYLSADQQYCFGITSKAREAHTIAVLCDGYATRLVSVDSEDKQAQVETFLQDLAVTTSEGVFIGLSNYLNDETKWVWYGGNVTSYENWSWGEPDTTARYNCAYMFAGSPDYLWRSTNCLSNYIGICERAATEADKV